MRRTKNTVVLGADGMLGGALLGSLERRRIPFTAVTEQALDLAELDEIAASLEALAPSAVINAAAFTDVGAAELPERRAEAFLINRDATRALGAACRAMGVPLVHVSTDYVFDGRLTRPYREEDETSPLQVYGQSKLEGEIALGEEYPDAVIARTSTLFGEGKRERPHYVDAILAQARVRDRLEVVELPVSSPTYAADLAEALLDLLERSAAGLVHVVNDGSCSRLELARAIVEEAGHGERVRVATRPDPGTGPGRPAYSVLDTSRLASLIGRRLRPWREAVRAYLARP